MSNPSQLFLLADHIKLSLLERQRALSLSINPNPSTTTQLARSLESFREGIESLSSRSSDTDSLTQLRAQYADLSSQFHGGSSSPTATQTLTTPNDASLREDFTHAQQKPNTNPQAQRTDSKKNVRFHDDPSASSLPDSETDTNRATLFPTHYTDTPSPPDPTVEMSNQQIHAYHNQVLSDQDSQLDTLSESIGRQRHLSMQIGDELEGQVALLDEVDRGVDRHQGRLDGARRRLDGVARTARRNWGMTTIVVLIVVLVLLIIVLK